MDEAADDSRVLAEAQYERLRQQLRMAISDLVRSWSLSQALAAERLGIARGVLNRIINNSERIPSLDTLLFVLLQADVGVAIHIGDAAAPIQDMQPYHGYYEFSGWTFNPAGLNLLTPEGVRVPVTAAEYKVLNALVKNANFIMSRQKIASVGNALSVDPNYRLIDVTIKNLQKKFAAHDDRSFIEKVVGKGFVFVPRVKARRS